MLRLGLYVAWCIAPNFNIISYFGHKKIKGYGYFSLGEVLRLSKMEARRQCSKTMNLV